MNAPAAPPRRRLPAWAIVLIVCAVVLAIPVGVVGVIAAGIVGSHVTADPDQAFREDDPAGGRACNALDSFQHFGDGSFADVRSAAAGSTTDGIRLADDPAAMHEACVNAGARMMPR